MTSSVREPYVEPKSTSCPECDGDIESADGEHRCRECGLVLEEGVTDPGPEWRSFDDDDATSEVKRVGASNTPTRHDRGIGTGREEGSELTIGLETAWLRWNSKKERNLSHGLGMVRRVCSALDVDYSITERACELFQTAHGNDVADGRTLEHVAAACVLIAVRESGFPLQLSDIREYIELNESDCRFWPVYHLVVDETNGSPGIREAIEFVGRLCNDLDLTPTARRRVSAHCRRAQDENIAPGAKPIGITAAAVYIESSHLSQRQVAEEAGITRRTLRDRKDDLHEVNDGE